MEQQPADGPTDHADAHPNDVVIVGGGLSGSLIAWRLKQTRPDVTVKLIERGQQLGGNHTWSFHQTDISPSLHRWLAPLIGHRWEGQEVHFPRYRRPLDTGYCSISSDDLHRVIAPALGAENILYSDVQHLDDSTVTLKSGERLRAGAVIDARGQGGFDHLILGYQKFVGCVYRFTKPHGWVNPVIMDATVSQHDGYRFVYVLPFTDDTALIEDTYYADGSLIETDTVIQRLAQYADSHGLEISKTLKVEQGVLPVALGGDIEAHLDEQINGVATVGLRAGLFHPLTGYSLPDAAALADLIANTPDLSGENLSQLTRNYAVRTWRERSFYRMLSRFLFDAAKPDERYLVMQRFYRLNRGLIERFYAGQSQTRDKLRVLAGKPPVNFFKAAACVGERQWSDRVLARAPG